MPSRDVQWIIGTIVAAVIAVSVQMGGIRSDFTEIRTDIRRQDDRLRTIGGEVTAVSQAVNTLRQTVDERLEDVDGDVAASSTAVRNEMVAMLEDVSGDVETLRQTVDQKLDDIDGDIQRAHDDLDGDVATLREEMNRRFDALPQLIRSSMPVPGVSLEEPALLPNIRSPFQPPPTVIGPPIEQAPSPRQPN